MDSVFQPDGAASHIRRLQNISHRIHSENTVNWCVGVGGWSIWSSARFFVIKASVLYKMSTSIQFALISWIISCVFYV